MARLILMRSTLSLVSLLAVSIVIFWSVEWLPGDTAQRILGRDATDESLAVLRHALQLDLPPWSRYLHWLLGTLQGDLGNSLVADRPVLDYVWSRAANTLTLAVVALALYLPLSLTLGLWTAIARGRAADHAVAVLV